MRATLVEEIDLVTYRDNSNLTPRIVRFDSLRETHQNAVTLEKDDFVENDDSRVMMIENLPEAFIELFFR